MQRTVDICSYLSSHSTSASVSELSRLVTHTAVSSPKCNSEKRPLSNSVAFQTLFKWHRYCGIFKIHIVRKINTGIRYEPVYRPALISAFLRCFEAERNEGDERRAAGECFSALLKWRSIASTSEYEVKEMCHCGLFSMPLWSVSTLMRINVCASLRVSTHAIINSLFVKWIFTFPLSIQLATIEEHHPVSELPRIPFAGDTQFSCWHMGVFFLGKICTGFCKLALQWKAK